MYGMIRTHNCSLTEPKDHSNVDCMLKIRGGEILVVLHAGGRRGSFQASDATRLVVLHAGGRSGSFQSSDATSLVVLHAGVRSGHSSFQMQLDLLYCTLEFAAVHSSLQIQPGQSQRNGRSLVTKAGNS